MQLRENAQAIADCETDLQQLEAIGGELDKQHARAKDAEAAGELEKRFLEAAAAIERSNEFFERNYTKHARAIAAGLELEQRARSLVEALGRDTRGRAVSVPPGLPAMARAFVGSEARNFAFSETTRDRAG